MGVKRGRKPAGQPKSEPKGSAANKGKATASAKTPRGGAAARAKDAAFKGGAAPPAATAKDAAKENAALQGQVAGLEKVKSRMSGEIDTLKREKKEAVDGRAKAEGELKKVKEQLAEAEKKKVAPVTVDSDDDLRPPTPEEVDAAKTHGINDMGDKEEKSVLLTHVANHMTHYDIKDTLARSYVSGLATQALTRRDELQKSVQIWMKADGSSKAQLLTVQGENQALQTEVSALKRAQVDAEGGGGGGGRWQNQALRSLMERVQSMIEVVKDDEGDVTAVLVAQKNAALTGMMKGLGLCLEDIRLLSEPTVLERLRLLLKSQTITTSPHQLITTFTTAPTVTHSGSEYFSVKVGKGVQELEVIEVLACLMFMTLQRNRGTNSGSLVQFTVTAYLVAIKSQIDGECETTLKSMTTDKLESTGASFSIVSKAIEARKYTALVDESSGLVGVKHGRGDDGISVVPSHHSVSEVGTTTGAKKVHCSACKGHHVRGAECHPTAHFPSTGRTLTASAVGSL